MSQDYPGTEGAQAYSRRWPALATLLLAGFMNLIDITIVNVALPRLQVSLGATSTEIEWMVAAYVLAFALGLLPFGRLGDVIGRKRMPGQGCLGVFPFLFRRKRRAGHCWFPQMSNGLPCRSSRRVLM